MKSASVGGIGAALLMAVGCGALASDPQQQHGRLGGAPAGDATGGQVTESGSGGRGTESTTDAGADGDLDADAAQPPANGLVLLDGGIESVLIAPCDPTVLEPNPSVPCNYLLPHPDSGSFDPSGTVVYTAGDATQYLVTFPNGSFGPVPNQATTCDLGWRFIGNYAEIEICGSTCEVTKNDPDARIDWVLDCWCCSP